MNFYKTFEKNLLVTKIIVMTKCFKQYKFFWKNVSNSGEQQGVGGMLLDLTFNRKTFVQYILELQGFEL